MKSISVLGAGSWGTAIATTAAERGVEVHLWSRNTEHLEEIAKLKENKRRERPMWTGTERKVKKDKRK